MTDHTGEVELGDVLVAFGALRRQNTRVLQAVADAHGVSLTDLRAIVRLQAQGTETPKALGAHLALTQGSVTALVDRVERVGLLRRDPHPSDRRSVLLRLTDAGTRVARDAQAVFERALGAAVPEDEYPVLHEIFTRLTAALRAEESRGAVRG